jgi:hypothetical protein
VRVTQVAWTQVANTNAWNVDQLHERHLGCLLLREANSRKASVIWQPVAVVVLEKKRVMNAILEPKSDTVLKVLTNVREAVVLLDPFVKVRIKAEKQEPCG